MLRIDQLEEDIMELEREKTSGEGTEGTVAASDAENPEEDMITGETASVLTFVSIEHHSERKCWIFFVQSCSLIVSLDADREMGGTRVEHSHQS